MKTKLLFSKRGLCYLIVLTLFTFNLQAQSCDCDYTLSSEDLDSATINVIWGSEIEAGSKICVPAGVYAAIRFYDLIGTPENRITIVNCGGQVEFSAPSYSAISLQRSSNVVLTGTGDSSIDYGFKISYTNSGAAGLYLENFTTDVEIDHVEITNTGFAGIMGKTDPVCSKPETWRSAGFVMKNINIHDNYIHDVGGEGIYLGFTGGYKVDSNRTCDGTPVFGHWLEDITIEDNIIDYTGLDGIQVNLARSNCKIMNNIVDHYAQNQQTFQDFAMSIGGGIYEIYNNRMYNSGTLKGKGIQLISAQSGTKVYNNVIEDNTFHGMFIHQRHEFDDTSEGYKIYNNTIIRPENSGIHYNTTITSSENGSLIGTRQDAVPTYLMNNFILDPGNDFEGGNTWKQNNESYLDFNNKSTRDAMLAYTLTNYMTRDTTGLELLADNSLNHYAITSSTSLLVDAGTDVATFGLIEDIRGVERPQGYGYDIGAFEFDYPEGWTPSQARAMNPKDLNIVVYPNPTANEFAVTGSKVTGATLFIRSMKGEVVHTTYNYDGENINISGLKKGAYLVSAINNGETNTAKLVKK
ncbi:Por secretion system C-terminal sorting domain-containing protein [Pustulibacterium marinum]|uniref:Por secretion system C-terminal sorting domain-containing protein n=1 Tax=Pustulibacterium marinum TaxID=1224947 RepID=A0A1I7IPP8_9FLAO|nr:right-handed parallel beta-helix repeat-containing protein [Pustulibacterium marinum]SFU74898.1 Por secretion system C-terminal sorting domain-containing protein [Pustulibacterium marinum]